MGFLAESQLFEFNSLRMVYLKETNADNDCITHLLLMTLHSESLPYRTLSYFIDVPISSANLIFILSTICGSKDLGQF